jgi:hypothetical protein
MITGITLTHYAPWDALGTHRVRALCGVYIHPTAHANAPTCARCRAYREEIERLDADLAIELALESERHKPSNGA